MPTYECTVTVNNIAGGAPYCALRAPTRTARLKEMRLVAGNGVASWVGLAVPANVALPPAPNASIVPVARDPREIACTGRIDTGWTTAPTAPTGPYNRSEPINGVLGNGIPWVFSDPEVIPIGSQIAVFNSGAGNSGSVQITFVFEE